MRNKRIIAMLMTVMLLAGSIQGLSLGARAAETVTPEVIVSGVRVTTDGTATGEETGYLELSVHVSASDFQTVGVVLSYDTEVLTPVDWSAAGKTVPVNGTMWTSVVPSKGADDFSGKPALARISGETATEPEPPEVDGEGQAEGTETVSEAGRGYLYLGAESLVYQDVSDTRLVTVRFKIAEDGDGYKAVTYPTDAAHLTDNGYDICLAPETVAEAAAPGAQVFMTLGEPAEILDGEMNPDAVGVYKLKYYAWRSTAGKYAEDETECAVSFRVEKGAGIGTGAAEPIGGGGYAITFFDWDGRAIDAVSAEPDTAASVVAAWEAKNAARLSNKPGYEFDCWLVVEEHNDGNGLVTEHDTFTSNDEPLPPGNQDVADLSDLFPDETKTSVFLQAAYYATEEVNNGLGVQDRENLGNGKTYYTLGTPTYYQYGLSDSNNGNYAVRCTVDRNTVLRATEPVVQAQIFVRNTGGTQMVTVKVDLENTDATSFEVVVPRSAISVSFQMRDAYGKLAWTTGTPRSDTGTAEQAVILKEGSFATMVDEAFTGHWEYAGVQTFIDAGYGKGVSVSNLATVRAALENGITSGGYTDSSQVTRSVVDGILRAYKS